LLHSLAGKTDEQIVQLAREKKISQYRLENELKKAVAAGLSPDCERAVRIRRLFVSPGDASDSKDGDPLHISDEPMSSGLPYRQFDYESFYQNVLGTNCENVIGYIPIPVGFVGPLLLDDKSYQVPLATTEGALVASTNRGCRAITMSGGASSAIMDDGMTRAPVARMSTAMEAAQLKLWLDTPETLATLQEQFSQTTSFGKLRSMKVAVAGRHVYIRFKCTTGDAMGMNMVSKGVDRVLEYIGQQFANFDVLAISGNYCIDKKPFSINWIEGRGKSVVCEVTLSGHVIADVLKCTVAEMVSLNTAKNLIGSAMAGSVGGNNAHASNIVTAAFLATGQDPAQNVESSNTITLMEAVNDGNDLHVSVTMPCLEVGTVGGGTSLAAQRACLDMLGVAGAHKTNPGQNAQDLARVISATVLAGEISLMSALASNHLVSAHLKLNRNDTNAAAATNTTDATSTPTSTATPSTSTSS